MWQLEVFKYFTSISLHAKNVLKPYKGTFFQKFIFEFWNLKLLRIFSLQQNILAAFIEVKNLKNLLLSKISFFPCYSFSMEWYILQGVPQGHRTESPPPPKHFFPV